MPTALADITGSDWSIKLNDPGSVVENLDDINQCINVILTTPKGSRAHEPLFGCDVWTFLDRPISSALPNIVAAVIEAIEEWETRILLTRVLPDYDGLATGHVTLKLEWKLKDYDVGIQQAEVSL